MLSLKNRNRFKRYLKDRGFSLREEISADLDPEQPLEVFCHRGHVTIVSFQFWYSRLSQQSDSMRCKRCLLRPIFILTIVLGITGVSGFTISLSLPWDFDFLGSIVVVGAMLAIGAIILHIVSSSSNAVDRAAEKRWKEACSKEAKEDEYAEMGGRDVVDQPPPERFTVSEAHASLALAPVTPNIARKIASPPATTRYPQIPRTITAYTERVEQWLESPFFMYFDAEDMPVIGRDEGMQDNLAKVLGAKEGSPMTIKRFFSTIHIDQEVYLSRYPVLGGGKHFRWRMRFTRASQGYAPSSVSITSGNFVEHHQLAFDLIFHVDKGFKLTEIGLAPAAPQRSTEAIFRVQMAVIPLASAVREPLPKSWRKMYTSFFGTTPMWKTETSTKLRQEIILLDQLIDELRKQIQAGFRFDGCDVEEDRATFHAARETVAVQDAMMKLRPGTEAFLAIPKPGTPYSREDVWNPGRDIIVLYDYEIAGIVEFVNTRKSSDYNITIKFSKPLKTKQERDEFREKCSAAWFLVNNAWATIAPYVRHRNETIEMVKGSCVNPRHQALLFSMANGMYNTITPFPIPLDPGVASVIRAGGTDPFYIDEYQHQAIMKALAGSDAVTINGGPGTGKTMVLAIIIILLARQDQIVFVAAQANNAVDVLLERVSRDKTGSIFFIRRGDERRMSEVAEKYTVENAPETFSREIIDTRLREMDRADEPRTFEGNAGQNSWADYCDAVAEFAGTSNKDEDAWFENSFLAAVPVTFMTTAYAAALKPDERIRAGISTCNVLILDECSKIDDYEYNGAMRRAGRFVFAGDVRQIPPHPPDMPNDVETAVRRQFRDQYKDVLGELTFEIFQSTIPKAGYASLLIQYRMPRLNMALANVFNPPDEQVTSGLKPDPVSRPLGAWRFPFLKGRASRWREVVPSYIFIHSTSPEDRKISRTNRGQVKIARALVLSWLPHLQRWDGPTPKTLRLISYYADMVDDLRKMVQDLKISFPNQASIVDEQVSAGTVDSNQGDEADIIIFCLTATEVSSFNLQPQRVNVGCTRARFQLFLLGDADCYEPELVAMSTLKHKRDDKRPYYQRAIQLARDNDTFVDEGRIDMEWRA